MAHNTNAQAILFCNQRVRPLADDLASLYLSCKSFVQQWTGQGLAALIPSDANLVEDGATTAGGAADGRPPITDAQVNILFAQASNLIAYFEGATGAPVNNASLQNYNQVLAVSPNPKAIF